MFQPCYEPAWPASPALSLLAACFASQREPIFCKDGDQDIYRDLLAEQLDKAGVEAWAYCLMPNHVHLILRPADEGGLAQPIGAAHRRWANFVNARGRWRGHLFDGRFASVVMDEAHLLAAVRYVALNPVRARLARRAQDWPWSSVGAHLSGEDDALVTVAPVLARVDQFADLIETDPDDPAFATIRAAETTGRPLATASFVTDLELRLGRPIARRAPGRKPSAGSQQQPVLL